MHIYLPFYFLSKYPTSKYSLNLYNRIQGLIHLSQFPKLAPKILHILFLRGISPQEIFGIKKVRNICIFIKSFKLTDARMFLFFCYQITIKSYGICPINRKMPRQEAIFITPKSNPNNIF